MSDLGKVSISIDLTELIDAVRAIQRAVARLETRLEAQEERGIAMSAQLDTIEREVRETNDAQEAAIALLEQLSALILSLKDDPVRLAALAAELDASAARLGAAVVANTPSDPNPPTP